MAARARSKSAAVAPAPIAAPQPPLPAWAGPAEASRSSVDSTSMFLRSFLQVPVTVPSFQRSFCWQADDVKGLLDSLVKGLPFGSILLWVGEGGWWMWEHAVVIDGLQRRSAFLHLFGGDRQPGIPDFGVDLRTGEVVEVDGSPYVLPSRICFEWRDYHAFSRRLYDLTDAPEVDLVTAGDIVRDRLSDIRVSVLTLRGDEAFAREAFRRLNTAGHPIGFDEVVACLQRDAAVTG